jgi:hypothetical protein
MEDKFAFVNFDVVAMLIVQWCPGYRYNEGAPMVEGDKAGFDGARLHAAARAAVNANLNLAYDRNDLIPEVTVWTRLALSVDLKNAESGTLCEQAPLYVKMGWIRERRQ